jgi:hypothetical protein
MRAQMLRAAAALLPALVLAACEPAGTDLGFGSEETGEVAVIVYLDRDASTTPTPLDTLYQGAVVSLRSLAGGSALVTATSNVEGVAFFPEVRFGDYLITVSSPSIGDSLVVARVDPDSIRVSAATNQVGAVARLAWPELSIREARARPPGTPVFIRGTILVGIPFFSDLSAHVRDTSQSLRMTGLTLLGGLAGNSPGDSVVVRGIVGQANGQPILSSARIIRVATRPGPIPVPVTTGVAASAQNGALDAALVNLTSITISDSMTTAPDFRVVASDGSGALTIVLDSNIPFNRLAFAPGRIMNILGVLVPSGTGNWVLKPRVPGDVTFLN